MSSCKIVELVNHPWVRRLAQHDDKYLKQRDDTYFSLIVLKLEEVLMSIVFMCERRDYERKQWRLLSEHTSCS